MDMDEIGDDDFYDTQEVLEHETGEDVIGSRTILPSPMPSKADFSVWSFLKQCIGKELSKITMPINFNEPLSFLQRLCEYMEYSDLLDQADQEKDPVKRLELVTAFAISASASNNERVGKPFNPVLGETYEMRYRGFTYVAEQISHHPPVSAFHVAHPAYRMHGAIHPKLKFWGRSVEVQPRGYITLEMLNHGEVYTWQNVYCNVHNIIIGKLWVEHTGHMKIINHSNGLYADITWRPCGWFKNDLHRVSGSIFNADGEKLSSLYGKWTEAMFAISPEYLDDNGNVSPTERNHSQKPLQTASSPNNKKKMKHTSSSNNNSTDSELEAMPNDPSDPQPEDSTPCNLHVPGQKCLWRAHPRPDNSKDYYNFTYYALRLNEYSESYFRSPISLPPTDCRLRKDMRLMEEGRIDEGSEEKHRIEEKQRAARKASGSNDVMASLWFVQGHNKYTGRKDDWFFNEDYWKRDWYRCPDLF